MNKRLFMTIFVTFCLVTLITTTAIVAGKNNNVKHNSNNKTTIKADFYDSRMEKAINQSQKVELNELKKKTRLFGLYKRNALIITNELPKDQKRLTLEEAENIIKEKNILNDINSFNDIIKSFNDIAGAPDWEVGSGTLRYYYYLDDKHSKVIVAFEGGFFKYKEVDENGKETLVKHLDGNGKKISVPSFSPSPN